MLTGDMLVNGVCFEVKIRKIYRKGVRSGKLNGDKWLKSQAVSRAFFPPPLGRLMSESLKAIHTGEIFLVKRMNLISELI